MDQFDPEIEDYSEFSPRPPLNKNKYVNLANSY